MQMNKIFRTPVGADLSRPRPIYRPVGARFICQHPLPGAHNAADRGAPGTGAFQSR
jgi:hypothetical protein